MDKYRISKLSKLSTSKNPLNVAADAVRDANMYGEDNLVLSYLLNFQDANLIQRRSSLEYHNYDTNTECERLYEESENTEKQIMSGNNKKRKTIENLLKYRKSHRVFQREVKKEELITIFDLVLRDRLSEIGNYRRVYPSGGGLYPIRILVYISGITGMKEGAYLYDHRRRFLLPYKSDFTNSMVMRIVEEQNMIFKNSIILIMYIYDYLQNYIKYHDIALSLAFIESGAISQTIQLVAPHFQVGYCDLGGFPKGKIEKVLRLNTPYYQVIHMGIMGGIK